MKHGVLPAVLSAVLACSSGPAAAQCAPGDVAAIRVSERFISDSEVRKEIGADPQQFDLIAIFRDGNTIEVMYMPLRSAGEPPLAQNFSVIIDERTMEVTGLFMGQ